MMALFRTGMPALNQARAELGLSHLRNSDELAATADRILVCTSPSFDFAAGAVAGNVRYVRHQLDDADGGGVGRSLARCGLSPAGPGRLEQHRDAPGGLAAASRRRSRTAPVHALVTTGPAVDPAVIRAPQNVAVRQWVRHADVLPHCSAVIAHGGHGTVIKALAAGVPLVVAPLGRDQPDIAARVVHAEAGLRVRKNASTAAL
jgi:hypothetical protein